MPFEICTQAMGWLRCASMEEIRTHTHTLSYTHSDFFPRLQNDSFGILWNARLCQFNFQEGNSTHSVAAAVAIRLKQRISMFERNEANDKESKKQQSERKQALYDVTFLEP